MHGHPCSGQESQVWALAMDQPGWSVPNQIIPLMWKTRKRIQILFWIITVSWRPCIRHPLYGNTIRFGDMIPAYRDRENIIAFERRGDKRLLVVSNFQNRQATLELPAPIKTSRFK